MLRLKTTTARCPRGSGYILAILFVCMLAPMVWAYATMVHRSLLQARNHTDIQAARLQAESGLSFITHLLKGVELSPEGSSEELLGEVAAHLSDQLDGTATLGGQSVVCDGTAIWVPSVSHDQGGSFQTKIWMPDGATFRLRVEGQADGVRRRVLLDFRLGPAPHPIFGYGIASKGPISLENDIKVLGANDPSEARLLSTFAGHAFRLEGNLQVDGDVYATDPTAGVFVSGTGTIGGAYMNSPEVMNHVHIGKGQGVFPEIDTAPFIPYATNVINSGADTESGRSFENIRIPPGLNPTFSGGTTINGVVYVRAPNQVTFAQGTTINGIIVTEDTGTPDPDNWIRFQDETYANGLDALPETPKWQELRQMAGAFILAPSFHVKFEHDAGVIGGYLAGEHFRFENAFDGVLKGGIVCYGTNEMNAENLTRFTIDHSEITMTPDGFKLNRLLLPQSDTYAED